ncbi:MAG TPA: hypothetical protein VF570_21470 [Pyrinomonadaceae bacterium]|jgi:hypothetical protein
MTAALSLGAGRRAAVGREELRRQLLALVLALVLVWYTLVVPASAPGPRRFEPEDEGHEGEVRGVKPSAVKADSRTAEELDWPEYIYP